MREAAAQVPAFDAVLTGPHAFSPDARGRVLVHVRLEDERPVRRSRGCSAPTCGRCTCRWPGCCRGADVDAVRTAVAGLLPLRTPVRELDVTVQRDRSLGSRR